MSIKNVTVIDSLMGTGKTEWAIQKFNNLPPYKRFIYISPFLAEVERIKNSVTNLEVTEPDNANSEGRKLRSLKELIASGKNIASTHALFRSADDELIDLLTDSGYTLVLDEVMDVIEPVDISEHDIKDLLLLGKIKIENNKVIWLDQTYEGPNRRNADIKLMAEAGTLFYHRGKFLVWAFPAEIFRIMEEVYVLTYLFEAQIQKYYFDLHQIDYTKKAVTKGEDGFYKLIEYNPKNEHREELIKLIDLYQGELNEIGENRRALSITRLRNADIDTLEKIRKNLRKYIREICNAKSKDVMWTTLKEIRKPVSGKGYGNGFLSFNARSTNDYSHKSVLAYILNRYMRPPEKAFFEDNGITVNQDLLAVSDLLQWVWRSRIREGEPINLYLPSRRMRELLKAWGNYEL